MLAHVSRAHFVPALLPEDAILVGPEGFHFGRWRAGLPDEPVLETYLAIACRRPLDAITRGALGKALAATRAGDLTRANICLAQAGLARAIGPDGLPARLAATEWLLDCGTPPDEVLAALDLGAPAPFAKYSPNQPRVPAGSGIESGRWTKALVAAASLFSQRVGPRALAAFSDLRFVPPPWRR